MNKCLQFDGSRATRISSFRASIRRALRADSGAELVEFAISSAVFFALSFAIIDFSLMMYSYFLVADAARVGARYAMVRGSSLSTDCSAPGPADCIAQPSDIQTFVRSSAFTGIDTNNLTVSATWLTSKGASCGTSDSCKTAGSQVQVSAAYNFSLTLPFVPQITPDMSSTSQMVIAQ